MSSPPTTKRPFSGQKVADSTRYGWAKALRRLREAPSQNLASEPSAVTTKLESGCTSMEVTTSGVSTVRTICCVLMSHRLQATRARQCTRGLQPHSVWKASLLIVVVDQSILLRCDARRLSDAWEH